MRKLYCLLIILLLNNCSSNNDPEILAPPVPVIVNYTLTVNAQDGGTVNSTGGSYASGESVTITATANSEYVFTGWSNGSTTNPLTLTISSNQTITANFEKVQYSLTIATEGEGTVSELLVSSGRATDYNSGSLVRLTAEASTGWEFTGWTGDYEGTENPIELTITEAKSLIANFEQSGKQVFIPWDGAFEIDAEDDWYFGRSRESENFVVFWEYEFGSDPNSSEIPQDMRVDIDLLLIKAEEYFLKNIELGFAIPGETGSYLNQYKLMIMLLYDDGWQAFGAGYNDVIGAIWISPATTKPGMSVVAHEIGHAFQYQVNCDLGGGSGYRYGFGPNESGGNGFWEQTAQYQAFKSYPELKFNEVDFYNNNSNKTFMHEDIRYQSHFIHSYWEEKHGIDFIGKLWRNSEKPEDPVQAYMRINNITLDDFHKEYFDAASKFVTWDLDNLREFGREHIDANSAIANLTYIEDRKYKISKEDSPGTTGYNIIKLNVPEAGTIVSLDFQGLLNDDEYDQIIIPSDASWRIGYVIQLENEERIYGDMSRADGDTPTTVSITIPEFTDKLWFVVTGAPNSYNPRPWIDPPHPEERWPYQITLTNTNQYGACNFNDTLLTNINLNYNLSFPVDENNYTGIILQLDEDDIIQLQEGFKLCSSDISSMIGNEIQFGALEADGNINYNYTANGFGHWFDVNGNVVNWSGGLSRIASEFNESEFIFNIVQYPGKLNSGESYSFKQVLVYNNYNAIFTFNILIE